MTSMAPLGGYGATEESPTDILSKSMGEPPPMDPGGGGGEGSGAPPAATIGAWGGTGHSPTGWTAGAGMFTALAQTGAGTAGVAGAAGAASGGGSAGYGGGGERPIGIGAIMGGTEDSSAVGGMGWDS